MTSSSQKAAAQERYSLPVLSWMSRRSPGGASVSSVTGGPEKMSSSSSPSPASECFSRQAARFSGEHPQWAESGLPPQLPASRLPWSMTPSAITPIKRANPITVMRSVASTSAGLAAPSRKTTPWPEIVTVLRVSGDDCQKPADRSRDVGSAQTAILIRCLPFFYSGVTAAPYVGRPTVGPSNRYVEATDGSRSLARGLVLGRPSTEWNVNTKGEAPTSGSTSSVRIGNDWN